jgi:hypothetical protein
MGKEDGYPFEKLKVPDNYKEWAGEMTFALRDAGLMGYVNGTIRNQFSMKHSINPS